MGFSGFCVIFVVFVIFVCFNGFVVAFVCFMVSAVGFVIFLPRWCLCSCGSYGYLFGGLCLWRVYFSVCVCVVGCGGPVVWADL